MRVRVCADTANTTILPSAFRDTMDYRKQMVVVSQPKIKMDDDDDEDLEALRLAALKSLGTKDATHNKRPAQIHKVLPQVTQLSHYNMYKNQRPTRKNFYHSRSQRQNGNVYYQSPRNPNLIAIVPVDEPSPFQHQAELTCPLKVEKTEPHVEAYSQEISKFHRFKDNGSASEEEDTKEQKSSAIFAKTEVISRKEAEKPLAEMESQKQIKESARKSEEDQEDDGNDDDDDVLLMADLEEEDSLERLMDEMEREMNVDKPSEKREKKSNKCESKDATRGDDKNKNLDQKMRSDESADKKDRNNTTISSMSTISKNERRSVSPHMTNRINLKRRSLSPRSRSRKKSPRRSPRRSPIRQSRRSPRESTRYRSPLRRSPSRYSPRSRSPRISPRRSPNRTSVHVKRSPMRKLSPRGRSPKLLTHSRSPRPRRSKSPRRSRSRSPKPRTPRMSHSRSPRLSRSRSPRYSPLRLSPPPPPPLRSPKSKSPRLSPARRTSPRRLSSRSRSPCSRGLSPPRKGSSPHLRSPWSSPRHSPRLSSPRRRRSPKSPKELPKKHGSRSDTPDNSVSLLYSRELSPPTFKSTTTPEIIRSKVKQKDELYEKPTTTTTMTEAMKESVDTVSDPVLEARRKKFESTRPIDPVNANKKIKLCKKYTASGTKRKVESLEETETQLSTVRKVSKTPEIEYDIQETDEETVFEYEELEGVENSSSPVASSIKACIDVKPQKTEKEKPPKKRKKRDKELYQVGKMKGELPLSERIGKDKKYSKKRKEIAVDGSNDDMDTIFEDITVDEEGDLRAELSRRRAERLNRIAPVQSARLVQSAFKGVVNEVVKNNAKANQRHIINTDEKSNQKEVRRVTVLHRSITELHDSEDESTLDSKVPVRFRLGLNKQVQESREPKATRKTSKRQGRKD